MRVEKIVNKSAELTCYILDSSLDGSNYGPRPAVLIYPGGGYYMCSAREAEPVAAEYLAAGFNAFVLRYSVGKDKTFDDSLSDAKWALSYIYEHSSELNTDPEKTAVCGFSAGGHLAAAVSVYSEVKPAAAILGYPCILEDTSEILAFHVPSVNIDVTESTPPAFIFASSDDKTVPVVNSLSYALALDKKKIPFELHIFEHGPHGFSVAKPHTAADCGDQYSLILSQWISMSIDFLNNIFKIGVAGQRKF